MRIDLTYISIIAFAIFLTLKLTGIGIVADWSWWWVTAPLWGIIPLMIISFIIMALIAIIIK